ncbi:MAG: PhnD/SsuA/transferrin family substrate-binding protein [Dethiobacter sp.]|jgi:phosphonate transport system substrate-binding protein|nr:PhnD/SsuA/transferrin family substrate-binding protein [Dethiobacter sp.]
MRGKSFAFTDPTSTLGTLYPLYLLKATGETADSFFKSHTFTFSSDNSIQSVADNLVDGAAVNSLVYDNMFARMPNLFKDMRFKRFIPQLQTAYEDIRAMSEALLR